MSLFAADGCIQPNTRTQTYLVTFAPNCGHTKIRGAQIAISAQSPEDARHYADTWLKLPQTHVTDVHEVTS